MYKTVKELSREQLEELRWSVFLDCAEKDDTIESPEYVTDETLYALYDGVQFTDDDFFCTAGKEVS